MDRPWGSIAHRPFGFFRDDGDPALRALLADPAVLLIAVDIAATGKSTALFERELLRAIAGKLDFPSYFGLNFAALDECIRDHRVDRRRSGRALSERLRRSLVSARRQHGHLAGNTVRRGVQSGASRQAALHGPARLSVSVALIDAQCYIIAYDRH